MSLLNHPEEQALLTDTVVTPDAVRDRDDRLTAFAPRLAAEQKRDRSLGDAGAAAQRGVADLPLAQGHRHIPSATAEAERESGDFRR